ncbi:copper transporter 6-like [Nymphaea colorata]|uniref:Copper transport protein n=2 Tax=Nymphaea colorata TaxID=210225 RepID=A0A5K1EE18_9MAGN|nr:copper transporter 6-like [Nymphaea colorata]XP_031487175.1 copper transporter 6-like [Nymphaea colorata]
MDMGGMDHGGAPPAAASKKVIMHMSLYWGKDVWILFADWPGTSLGQYILSLIIVFLGAVIVEWLAFLKTNQKPGLNPIPTGFFQAVVYGFRVFFAYCVMLAVMSFNLGVVIVAVVGHGVGYWLFGTQAFKKKSVEPTLKDGGQCC